MPELIPVLPKKMIEKKISAVARELTSDYKGRKPVFIGVLKGAFVFLSDLVRHMEIPVYIDFLQAASYGKETSSSGDIRILHDIGIDIADRDVVLVEDIIDTGLTLAFLMEHLKSFDPASIRVCTLIDKRERREQTVDIHYACHHVQEGFLVGYGLDYAEDYRHLPDIYHLKL